MQTAMFLNLMWPVLAEALAGVHAIKTNSRMFLDKGNPLNIFALR